MPKQASGVAVLLMSVGYVLLEKYKLESRVIMQGRRRYGGPGAGRQTGNIWEVVSTLAQALTSARDQLVGLMPAHQSYGRNCGLSTRPPSRRYLPKAGARVPNIHRNHAHGHVAFGSNSEYCQQPNVSPPRYRPVTMASQRLCQHPLHFKQCVSPSRCSPKRRVQFGVHVDPNNAVHINSTNNNSCRKGAPLSICFAPTPPGTSTRTYGPGPGPGPRSGYLTGCNPDSKRHCIGTQYAALLEEEAYHLRERRLAEEYNVKRPAWNRT